MTVLCHLTHNSIVVFTGPNNSGKSQVLREIELLIKDPKNLSVVVSELTTEMLGELDDEFFVSKFKREENGCYCLGGSGRYPKDWKYQWSTHLLLTLSTLFVNRLDTEERLTASKTKQLYSNSPHEQLSSLHTLYKSNIIEDSIAQLFHEAFGESLIVNRRAGTNVSLHVGERPSWTGERDGEGAYYDAVGALPMAFLHPPQARIIGKMLAKNNPCERQLYIATHSADFINGLLDANNDNIVVIRINRNGSTNHMNTLGNDCQP